MNDLGSPPDHVGKIGILAQLVIHLALDLALLEGGPAAIGGALVGSYYGNEFGLWLYDHW